MSILRPKERRAASLSTLTQILEAVGRSPRTAGTSVSDEKAMTLSAFWACVRLLSDNVAGLPVDAYRRTPGVRREIDPQPALVAQPSAIVSRSTWLYQQMVSLLLRGNAYGVVTAIGADGWPTKVEIVHPDTMQVLQPDQLAPPDYLFGGKPIDRSRVYHVTAYNTPGSVSGLAPVAYGARNLGIAVEAENYALELLAGGGHPTAILKAKTPVDDEQAKRAKQRFREATTGDHLAVLGNDIDYQRIQITPAEMAVMESRQISAVDICRFFGVPPEMIGAAMSGSSVTYANREQRAIDFLVFTLQWWLTRIEEAWSAQLPRPQYVKFNADALLRVDAETRTKITVMKLRNGLLNADEGRALDDNPPLPDDQGQLFLWPPMQGAANDGSTKSSE